MMSMMWRVALGLAIVAVVSTVALAADWDSPDRETMGTPEVLMPTEPTGPVGPADQPRSSQPPPPECVPDELLVKFRPGADPVEVSARYGGTIGEHIAGIDVYLVKIPYGTVDQKVAEFQADPDVMYAEPNAIVRIAEPPPDPHLCGP